MKEDILEKSEYNPDPASHFNMKRKLKNFVHKLIKNQMTEYETIGEKIFREVRTLEEAHELHIFLEQDFSYFITENLMNAVYRLIKIQEKIKKSQ